MKKFAGLFLFLNIASFALGQDASDKQLTTTRYASTEVKPTLDLFHIDSSYVFESDIDSDDVLGFGKQDALQSGIDYSHRFYLAGKVYLRAGVSYNRFDFSRTTLPLPVHLQSLSATLALEYIVGNDVGAFIRFDPGFYAENDFGISSFDVPITLGRIFVLQQDKLFLFVGANTAFLRGEYPVLPIAGIVWRPNRQWTLNLVPPQPRLIYSPNDKLDLWVGGQLTGWSYRTDRDETIVPRKLSNAQVDYSEYRAGAGFTFHPCDQMAIDVGGGYAFQRRFNFERAGEEFTADPAPYVRVAFKAEF